MVNQLEQEYAPPSHEVFQLTPSAFHQAATAVYNELGQPEVTYDSFWTVYQRLLAGIEAVAAGKLMVVMDAHAQTVQRMNSDDNEINQMDLLPDQRPQGLGDAAVGFHQVIQDSRSVRESDIVYAAFSDDEPEEDEV